MITAQRLVRGPWVSSCHPGFEGPKGMITKGIAPVSAISASMVALWSFSSPPQWKLLFQRLVDDNTVSAGRTWATWQTFSQSQENIHCFGFFQSHTEVSIWRIHTTFPPWSWSGCPLGCFYEDGWQKNFIFWRLVNGRGQWMLQRRR